MKRTDDDAFRRQLHDAGAAVTPPTSEQLHARVMRDVRRERATSSAAFTSGRASGWWLTIGAIATAVVVMVWLTTTSREPDQAPIVKRDVPSLPPLPSIEKVVVEQVEPVRTKLHEARFAYLDRDTKRLARFLVRAVPVPAQAKEEATGGL